MVSSYDRPTFDANVAFSEHKTKDFIVEPKPLEE